MQALTELLGVETDLVSSNAAPSSEEFSTYYGDLIQAVTTLRDSSSTHVLMRCVNTGNMAIAVLAGFGETALSEALSALPSADIETRHAFSALFSNV